jgi:hypothetical protein
MLSYISKKGAFFAMEQSIGTIVYSKPGNNEMFSRIWGKSVAGQSFFALGTCIVEASIWLTEANNDSVKIDIITDDLYGGYVLASGMLPSGETGKERLYLQARCMLRKIRPIA